MMSYSTGATLKLDRFSDVAIDGRGGNDSACLVAGLGVNTFDGSLTSAKLSNGSFTRALANFSKVSVFGNEDENAKSTLIAELRDTAFADAFAAFGNTATMGVDGDNLFTIVAADQVAVKRSVAKGADTVDQGAVIDFVFSVDNWKTDPGLSALLARHRSKKTLGSVLRNRGFSFFQTVN